MNTEQAVSLPLPEVVRRWAETLSIAPERLPDMSRLRWDLAEVAIGGPSRPPCEPGMISAWEHRHGFRLPRALRDWLALSDGLYRQGPLIHPLSAIGPMVPFATVPGLVVQPESWFELGNPGAETVCIDLAYAWPGGGCPIFTSGDDEAGTTPKIIAPGFDAWLLRLLHEGGRSYWFDPDFTSLGDPWEEHRRRVPAPPLPERLRPLAPRLGPLLRRDADERSIARELGITRGDVEAIFRHLQHAHATG